MGRAKEIIVKVIPSKIANEFVKNFTQFESDANEEIMAAAPKAKATV